MSTPNSHKPIWKIKNLYERIIRSRLHYLAFLGPGLITAASGNDAGGIATYAVAGANYGLNLLWVMFPLTLCFLLVQDMSGRLGAATGKGFSDLVRENFDLRATIFMMILTVITNIGLIVSEFAGIAAALELFGISKYISIPLATALIWYLIVKGTYQKIEKVFLLMSAILLSYVITTFLAKPDWSQVAEKFFIPTIQNDAAYYTFLVALIGTTIAPFMQIFAQSAVVEKGITMSHYKYERADIITGVLFANLVACFIIIATSTTLHSQGLRIETASDAAYALAPVAGQFATVLFGVGLLGASLLAAGVVPLTTSFALANAFGWESGVNRSFEQAPIFYAIFTFLLVASATIVLSPALSLIQLLIGFQVLNGILLPFQLFFIVKLCNDKYVMGKYTNSFGYNLAAYTTIIFVSSASILFIGTNLLNTLSKYF